MPISNSMTSSMSYMSKIIVLMILLVFDNLGPNFQWESIEDGESNLCAKFH